MFAARIIPEFAACATNRWSGQCLSHQTPDSTNTLLFFVENRFLRYQQARINVGHGAGYVIEPGRQTPYSHFPLCTSF
jgi:hypothetical protein